MKSTAFIATVAALFCGACSASRDAANLSDITGAHLNSLGTQLQDYVASADQSRSSDAERLAAVQRYFRSVENIAQGEVRSWHAEPDNKEAAAKITVYEVLQKDAAADMANTQSDIQWQATTAESLQKKYGKLTYDSGKLQDALTQLQALSKRSDTASQLQVTYEFSADVFKDTSAALAAKQLNPNGVAKSGVPKPPGAP